MSRGWLAVVLVAACSTTPDTGQAAVSGTVGGSPFTVGDAIVVVDGAHAKLVISSAADTCADVRDGIARQNLRVLLLEVTDAADPALIAGSYNTFTSDTPPTLSALFESHLNDAQCAVTYVPPPDGIGDGIVTVSAVAGGTVDGTFDMILDGGEHITGTFHPAACPALAKPPTPTSCLP